MISGLWRISYWVINGAFLLPVGIVFALAFWPDASGMLALWQQGMPLYLLHTTILVCGAVTLSLLIGLPGLWPITVFPVNATLPGPCAYRWPCPPF